VKKEFVTADAVLLCGKKNKRGAEENRSPVEGLREKRYPKTAREGGGSRAGASTMPQKKLKPLWQREQSKCEEKGRFRESLCGGKKSPPTREFFSGEKSSRREFFKKNPKIFPCFSK